MNGTATMTPASLVHKAHAALHVAMEAPRCGSSPARSSPSSSRWTLTGPRPRRAGLGLDLAAPVEMSRPGPDALLRGCRGSRDCGGALIAAMAAPAAKSGTEDEKSAVVGVTA